MLLNSHDLRSYGQLLSLFICILNFDDFYRDKFVNRLSSGYSTCREVVELIKFMVSDGSFTFSIVTAKLYKKETMIVFTISYIFI